MQAILNHVYSSVALHVWFGKRFGAATQLTKVIGGMTSGRALGLAITSSKDTFGDEYFVSQKTSVDL